MAHCLKQRSRVFAAITALSAAATAAPVYAGDRPHFKTIDVPGAAATMIYGNSEDAVAGGYVDAGGNMHGFVKRSRAPVEEVVVNGTGVNPSQNQVNGINDRGDLIGSYLDDTGFHAYLRRNGVFSTLEPVNSSRSAGGFINAHGDAVGIYRTKDAPTVRHGFLWRRGVFTTIDAPASFGTTQTIANGINDRGDIVGAYYDGAGSRHGFLLRWGRYVKIDVPNAVETFAQGINDAGVVAGYYVDGSGKHHGFVLSRGIYRTIDAASSSGVAVSTDINSINQEGEVAGSYDDSAGVTHGFVARGARFDLQAQR